jgi:GAF domain-containing protein
MMPMLPIQPPPRLDVVTTLVRLADTLAVDFDLAESIDELAANCVRLLGVTAAGVVLAEPRGGLRVVGATSEGCRLLQELQVNADAGPSIDCFRTGLMVSVPDLLAAAPILAPSGSAEDLGLRGLCALPMRLRDQVIGVMTLGSATPGELDEALVLIGQALADMTTITILRERALAETTKLATQLQTALTSRVVLEQAKGVLAERGGVSVDEAFKILRKYARDHNAKLDDVSRAVVANAADVVIVLDNSQADSKTR